MRTQITTNDQKKLLFETYFKPLEYSTRIIELALALHIYADFKMIGVTRHEKAIKEVYAYDISKRIYTFKGAGRTIDNHNFESLKEIDEAAVRRLYSTVNEELIERIAHVAQVLWPTISWNAKSKLKKVLTFANRLEELCKIHNFSLRPSLDGIIVVNSFEGETHALAPTPFLGEYKIVRKTDGF